MIARRQPPSRMPPITSSAPDERRGEEKFPLFPSIFLLNFNPHGVLFSMVKIKIPISLRPADRAKNNAPSGMVDDNPAEH